MNIRSGKSNPRGFYNLLDAHNLYGYDALAVQEALRKLGQLYCKLLFYNVVKRPDYHAEYGDYQDIN
tara:strand:- start:83 stop:283 length:201 start_codon:yes stop_codon:yes gene_type:complete